MESNLRISKTRMKHLDDLYESRHHLIHDHIVGMNQVAYIAHHMVVFDHERDLDNGRFEHFTHEGRENVVTLTLDESRCERPWNHQVRMWVNWIAEHVDSPWSLHVAMEHTRRGTFTFSFDDHVKAVFFKLVFA
jgi:hypothetical protein